MLDTVVLDADELLVLARADLEQGRMDRALIKFKAGLSMKDPPPDLVLEAGRLYAQLGLRQKALPMFERFLSLVPDHLDAQFQMGMLHFESGDLAAAGAIWSRVLERDSLYPPALFYSALGFAEGARVEEAITLLKKLLTNIPADNLYFSRARELLPSLEARLDEVGTGRRMVSAESYKTEH